MSASPHLDLWKRVAGALQDRGIGPADGQREVARLARDTLGTDLVERFLDDYFFGRQYGGGSSKLTDEQAEALVRQIEDLPRPLAGAPVEPAAPRGVILAPDQPPAFEPAPRTWPERSKWPSSPTSRE